MHLEPFTRASPRLMDAVDVYVATWGHARESSYQFIFHYAGLPGFHGRVAIDGGRVVGMGFGVDALAGNWWVDIVAGALGRRHPALQHAWTLVELAVRPGHRSRGVGTLIHDALWASHDRPRAVLSTQATNEGAQRLYLRLGWQILHPGLVFPGNPVPYVIMGRERNPILTTSSGG
jgi:ribosomal protein S18 acetylase RimI-like enzyme